MNSPDDFQYPAFLSSNEARYARILDTKNSPGEVTELYSLKGPHHVYQSLRPRRTSSRRPALVRSFLALLLSLCISAISVIVVFFDIIIAPLAEFSSTRQTLYAMCLASVATVFQIFVLSEIQALWIRRMNFSVRHTLALPDARHRLPDDNSRWCTILRISSLSQQLSNSYIVLSYLSAALITTAAVAACTISTTPKSTTVPTMIPIGDPNDCGHIFDNSLDIDGYNVWTLPNGTFYTIRWSDNPCPMRQAITLAGSINTVDPLSFAYADLGIAGTSGAIGASSTI